MSEGKDTGPLLLRALLPHSIADALAEHLDDIPFVAEQALKYIEGDEADRADILAFHESDGVNLIHQAHEKHENETPTAADLEDWVSEGEDAE